MLIPQIPNRSSKEPALNTGISVGAGTSVASVIVYFLPDSVTDQQKFLIAVTIAILAPFVTALFTRKYVWSPYSVYELLKKSVNEAEQKINEQGNKRQFPGPS